MWRGRHNNQAVLDLLQSSESDLLKERQAGKSWLELATAHGVSEKELLDALLQPMPAMHAGRAQNYPQAKVSQMTDWMREQFAAEIRITAYGSRTDRHVFGGGLRGGMMNGGMMNGGMMNGGMMNGGMMNGGMMDGGMMGGWMNGGMMDGRNNTPNVLATPVPATQKIDREIQIVARNFKFEPARVAVRAGETVEFVISNEDNFAHNAVSQWGQVAYTVLPANDTTSIVWAAPGEAGTYTVTCTWHPRMQFSILVEP
jgi:plastocyanin